MARVRACVIRFTQRPREPSALGAATPVTRSAARPWLRGRANGSRNCWNPGTKRDCGTLSTKSMGPFRDGGRAVPPARSLLRFGPPRPPVSSPRHVASTSTRMSARARACPAAAPAAAELVAWAKWKVVAGRSLRGAPPPRSGPPGGRPRARGGPLNSCVATAKRALTRVLRGGRGGGRRTEILRIRPRRLAARVSSAPGRCGDRAARSKRGRECAPRQTAVYTLLQGAPGRPQPLTAAPPCCRAAARRCRRCRAAPRRCRGCRAPRRCRGARAAGARRRPPRGATRTARARSSRSRS